MRCTGAAGGAHCQWRVDSGRPVILFVRPQRSNPFPNREHQQTDPLEAAIAAELWRWAFAPQEVRVDIAAVQSELSTKLEFYLCGAFQLIDFTRSRGIWCDGVIELSIMKISRCSFLTVGAAYAPTHLAPFEIEFHFGRRRDHVPLRTIIRFGKRGPDSEIQWYANTKNAATIVANRPQYDRDWAIAVELTSTET